MHLAFYLCRWIVIIGNDQGDIQHLKQHLFKHVPTKDLSPLRYFLAIEVAQSKMGVDISQMKYTLNILVETRMLDCMSVDTPMDQSIKL